MKTESPLDLLRQDHGIADRALTELAHLIGEPGAPAPDDAAASAAALRNGLAEARDVLLLHFRREEEALFPQVRAIISQGAPAVDILTQFLDGEADDDLRAHVTMRSRLRELAELLDVGAGRGRLGSDDLGAFRTIASALRDLFRRHMDKEHKLIFPMIERMLDEAQMAQVAQRMAEVRPTV